MEKKCYSLTRSKKNKAKCAELWENGDEEERGRSPDQCEGKRETDTEK